MYILLFVHDQLSALSVWWETKESESDVADIMKLLWAAVRWRAIQKCKYACLNAIRVAEKYESMKFLRVLSMSLSRWFYFFCKKQTNLFSRLLHFHSLRVRYEVFLVEFIENKNSLSVPVEWWMHRHRKENKKNKKITNSVGI